MKLNLGRNKVAARKCRERRIPTSGRNSVSIAYDDEDMYEPVVNQVNKIFALNYYSFIRSIVV